ncbi:hypothetical protein [Pontibacter anaerobius]|uniref:Uncharacterized protein n=1 Tax=Pontibacter anaerobius TaxID=2993940 RepID=A0ABT3RI11_9BACT|nr:hypothetical protein [Pontibacter anaerobius]MCX2741039.1 hypothetical protein [Pontibacter anaerobius]
MRTAAKSPSLYFSGNLATTTANAYTSFMPIGACCCCLHQFTGMRAC